MDPLEHPPEIEEGDNADAGGGKPVAPVKESELADAEELTEDEIGDSDDA